MKCRTCGGKGFTEQESGMVQIACPDCDGSKEIGIAIVGKPPVAALRREASDDLLAIAQDMAAKGGHHWEDLDVVMSNAYIHNAELVYAERCMEAEKASELVDEAEKRTMEKEDAELDEPIKRVMEAAQNLLAQDSYIPPLPTPPATKERQLKPSEYLCSKCNTPHRASSKIGIRHLKHGASDDNTS